MTYVFSLTGELADEADSETVKQLFEDTVRSLRSLQVDHTPVSGSIYGIEGAESATDVPEQADEVEETEGAEESDLDDEEDKKE